MAPKFDPNKPFEVVQDQATSSAKFDPNQPYEEVEQPQESFQKTGAPVESKAAQVAKAYVAPVVGLSKMANIPASLILGAYRSYSEGKPFKQAYDESLAKIREAQKSVTESSMVAHYGGKVGELAGAIAMPGKGLIKGAIGGAYTAASEGETAEQQKELAKGGAIFGGAFGGAGKYISGKIKSAKEYKELAQEKAIQYFQSSKKFIEKELQYIKGKTLDEKIATYGDFLVKKSIVADDKISIREVSKKALEGRNATSGILEGMKQEALKANPKVDTLDVYETIKRITVDMADQPAEKKALQNIFKDVHAGAKKTYGSQNKLISSGEKSLSELNEVYQKLNKNYGKLYEKPITSRTPQQERILDGLKELKNVIDEKTMQALTDIDPAKAASYMKIKTDYHMFEQTRELANDRLAQLISKKPDIPVGNVKYAPYVAAGRGIQDILKGTSKTPEQLMKMGKFSGVKKQLIGSGQKGAFAYGQISPEGPQE